MIIHIAPWSNDPSEENRAPPLPPLLLLFFVRITHGYSAKRWLLSCNTGSPLFIPEKGRNSLKGKRVCAKASEKKVGI